MPAQLGNSRRARVAAGLLLLLPAPWCAPQWSPAQPPAQHDTGGNKLNRIPLNKYVGYIELTKQTKMILE
jgi:hypothetical protein